MGVCLASLVTPVSFHSPCARHHPPPDRSGELTKEHSVWSMGGAGVKLGRSGHPLVTSGGAIRTSEKLRDNHLQMSAQKSAAPLLVPSAPPVRTRVITTRDKGIKKNGLTPKERFAVKQKSLVDSILQFCGCLDRGGGEREVHACRLRLHDSGGCPHPLRQHALDYVHGSDTHVLHDGSLRRAMRASEARRGGRGEALRRHARAAVRATAAAGGMTNTPGRWPGRVGGGVSCPRLARSGTGRR